MTIPDIAHDAPTDAYRPGACNIGSAEIGRRRRAGFTGLLVAAGLGATLVALDAPSAARLLVALPLAGGAVGLLQAHFRFCAGYGMAGVRNFGDLGSVERVEDAAARRADRSRAIAIFLAGAGIGLAGAAAFALLPLAR